MDNGGIRVQEYLGKEVISLKDGSYLGKVQSMVIDTESRGITGLAVRLKGLLGGKMYIPLAGIQGFGYHGITVKEDFKPEENRAIEEKEILNMPVITDQGTLLGRVSDFIFDISTGKILEYILTEGAVKDTFRKRAILKADDVFRIGKDVLIASGGPERLSVMEEPVEFVEPEIVDDWEQNNSNAEKAKADKSWEQVVHEAKEISEKWKKTFKEQSSKLGVEAQEIKDSSQQKLETLFGEAQEKVQEQLEKLNKVKDVWEEKLNKVQVESRDELGDQLLMEIKGKTINKALVDDQGLELVGAGQIIDDQIIKATIEAGKIHDLFVLVATKDMADVIERIDPPVES